MCLAHPEKSISQRRERYRSNNIYCPPRDRKRPREHKSAAQGLFRVSGYRTELRIDIWVLINSDDNGKESENGIREGFGETTQPDDPAEQGEGPPLQEPAQEGPGIRH